MARWQVFAGSLFALAGADMAEATTVRGTVNLEGQASSSNSVQNDPNFVHLTAERDAGNVLTGYSAQQGEVTVDWDAGTFRGKQRALDQSGPLGPLTTGVLGEAFGSLQVQANQPGLPSTALLQLTMTVDATFDFPDLAPEPGAEGSNSLRAIMQLFRGSFQVAQVEYLYAWSLSNAFEQVLHNKGGFVQCGGCSYSVTAESEERRGFSNAELSLFIPMSVGDALAFSFVVSGSNSVKLFGANGDWDNTAKLGFVLPAGYSLMDDSGNDLASWNVTPVPLPATLPLFTGALLGLMRGTPRRTALAA